MGIEPTTSRGYSHTHVRMSHDWPLSILLDKEISYTYRIEICDAHFLEHRYSDVRSPGGGIAGASQEHLARRR